MSLEDKLNSCCLDLNQWSVINNYPHPHDSAQCVVHKRDLVLLLIKLMKLHLNHTRCFKFDLVIQNLE
jgi:hypothetical protein